MLDDRQRPTRSDAILPAPDFADARAKLRREGKLIHSISIRGNKLIAFCDGQEILDLNAPRPRQPAEEHRTRAAIIAQMVADAQLRVTGLTPQGEPILEAVEAE